MASDPLGTLEEVFDFLGLDLIDADGIQVTALGIPLLLVVRFSSVLTGKGGIADKQHSSSANA